MRSDENKADINKKIKSFDIYVSSKVQKCGRNMRTFRVKYSQWLAKSLKIVFNNQEVISCFKIGTHGCLMLKQVLGLKEN